MTTKHQAPHSTKRPEDEPEPEEEPVPPPAPSELGEEKPASIYVELGNG